MHILILIVTVTLGLATWYSRLRMVGKAARNAGRVAQTVRNAPRKFAFMRRAGKTGLKVVDDPREASAILMVLVAGGHSGHVIATERERAIKEEVSKVFDLDSTDAEDLLTHAVWMVRDVDLVSGVVLRMTQVVKQTPGIGAAELVDLYEMLEAVSRADGEPDEAQSRILDLYRNKVGIQL